MSSAADQDARFIAEVLPAFVSEAREQLERVEQLLLELEADPQDRARLDELFRCAHTVKGSAGIFGLDRVVAFTHHVETLLDRLRDGELGLTPALSTLLLECTDEIRALVAGAQDADAVDRDVEAAARRDALVLALQAMTGGAPAATPAPVPTADDPARTAAPCWRIAAAFGPDTFRNGLDPLAVLVYLRGLGTIERIACDTDAVPSLETLDPETCRLSFTFELAGAATRDEIEGAFSFVRDDCELSITASSAAAAAGATAPTMTSTTAEAAASVDVAARAVVAAPADKPRPRDGAAPDEARFIRVQADRLDAVINLLGELVIASAGASMLARQARQSALLEANQQVGALVEEIRNSTLQLRMVPIGETFSRFRRVVRDTAAELGKDVALELVGGDTELDKSVVERITDPLMHVVRNALDHGLETPEQRVAAGKPARGTLTMSACHESGSILIRIADDGRGIQRERVLERAWERGLVERGVVPPDAQILRLIFEPGFSTAEAVTNLSGRGVGMDVVRRNIEALRGSVELSSEPGAGSRIDIRLPLTLAIIDGFLVGVGNSKFVLPLDAVVEVIEPQPGAAVDAAGRSTVALRGKVLPVVDLRALYGLGGAEPARGSIVVVRAAAERYGVHVDQLLGQHQTVIKPLGRMFRSLRGMSGSSILGNGEVALIFDPVSLGQLAASRHAAPRTSRPVAGTVDSSSASLPQGLSS